MFKEPNERKYNELYNDLKNGIKGIVDTVVECLNQLNSLPDNPEITIKDLGNAEMYIFYDCCYLDEKELAFKLGADIRTGRKNYGNN